MRYSQVNVDPWKGASRYLGPPLPSSFRKMSPSGPLFNSWNSWGEKCWGEIVFSGVLPFQDRVCFCMQLFFVTLVQKFHKVYLKCSVSTKKHGKHVFCSGIGLCFEFLSCLQCYHSSLFCYFGCFVSLRFGGRLRCFSLFLLPAFIIIKFLFFHFSEVSLGLTKKQRKMETAPNHDVLLCYPVLLFCFFLLISMLAQHSSLLCGFEKKEWQNKREEKEEETGKKGFWKTCSWVWLTSCSCIVCVCVCLSVRIVAKTIHCRDTKT